MAVYIVGKVSGGHINPAVTVAESVMGNFKWTEVPLYIIAQVFIFKNCTNIPYFNLLFLIYGIPGYRKAKIPETLIGFRLNFHEHRGSNKF